MRVYRITTVALLAVVFVCVSTNGAGEESKPALKVGQLQGVTSLPFSEIQRACPGFSLSEATLFRSEVYPLTNALPTTVSGLPDIVNPLVGFWQNDLSALIENGLIEPLDPILAELGIAPEDFLTEDLLAAVSLNGKICAIPHRVQTYLLTYNKPVFDRLGMQPEFSNWEDVLKAASRISAEAVPGKRISGFEGERLDKMEHVFASTIQLASSSSKEDSAAALFTKYLDAWVTKDDYYRAPEHEFALNLELLSQVTSGSTTGIIALPTALTAGSTRAVRPVSYIECFAVRKNSEEKKSAAFAFIRWLLAPETQLMLVEDTRIDRPKGALNYRHIPLFKRDVEGQGFKAVAEEAPEYRLVLDILHRSEFASADAGISEARFEAARTKRDKAEQIASTMGEAAAYLALLAPPEATDAAAAPRASDKSKLNEY